MYHLAGEFARSLKRQLEEDKLKLKEKDNEIKEMYRFDDKEVLCVELAGLCHDLGIITCGTFRTVTLEMYYYIASHTLS